MFTDPRNIPDRELERMRAEVMRAYGINDWTRYTEKQAAWLMTDPAQRREEADTSTLKRNRRAGRVPFTQTGPDGVRYWGKQIADYLLFGEAGWFLWGQVPSKAWCEKFGYPTGGAEWAGPDTTNGNTASVSGTSPREGTAPPSTAAASTAKPDAQSVLRSALQAGKRPKVA